MLCAEERFGSCFLLGEALLAACSTVLWGGQSSSQPGVFTSRENQAQDVVGLAFKTQDSNSSEHFTKSHWNEATVKFII